MGANVSVYDGEARHYGVGVHLVGSLVLRKTWAKPSLSDWKPLTP